MVKRLGRVFLTGLRLGSTSFGGITAAYPTIRAAAVGYDWMPGEEVDALYAVAVVLPGPSFMNLWGAIGGRVAGLVGVLVGLTGLLLPSFLLVMAVMLLTRLHDVAAHSAGLMQGAAWATAGLIGVSGVESFFRLRSRWQQGQMTGVFGLLLLGLNPLLLLGLSMLFGAAVPQGAGRKENA